MGQALDEFVARIENLRRDVLFVRSAAAFRPQVHKVLDRKGDRYARTLAESFAAISDSEVSAIYGPLIVRLSASLERYLRSMIVESIEAWRAKAGSFDKLPESIRVRNLIQTGRLLANSEEPRDYLKNDTATLVSNLASCSGKAPNFILNGDAFSALVSGITPDALDNSLRAIKISDCWDGVCADDKVKRVLKMDRTADSAKEAQRRLKELSRRRNNWAHGGDEEVALTDVELLSECDFVLSFGRALDAFVIKRINAAKID